MDRMDPNSRFDQQTPSTARIYNVFLGGKDNYPVDRDAAARVIAAVPYIPALAVANYMWSGRVARHYASEGFTQFADIGLGIPLNDKRRPSTFEAARAENPEARVVGFDNDPIVLVHGRALRDDGSDQVEILEGDIRDPDPIIDQMEARFTGAPVVVIIAAVLHFVTALEDPYRIVARFRERLPSRSRIAISHLSSDGMAAETRKELEDIYSGATSPAVPRTDAEIAALFGGMELDAPGLVDVQEWRPDMTAQVMPIRGLCGVGCVP